MTRKRHNLLTSRTFRLRKKASKLGDLGRPGTTTRHARIFSTVGSGLDRLVSYHHRIVPVLLSDVFFVPFPIYSGRESEHTTVSWQRNSAPNRTQNLFFLLVSQPFQSCRSTKPAVQAVGLGLAGMPRSFASWNKTQVPRIISSVEMTGRQCTEPCVGWTRFGRQTCVCVATRLLRAIPRRRRHTLRDLLRGRPAAVSSTCSCSV